VRSWLIVLIMMAHTSGALAEVSPLTLALIRRDCPELEHELVYLSDNTESTIIHANGRIVSNRRFDCNGMWDNGEYRSLDRGQNVLWEEMESVRLTDRERIWIGYDNGTVDGDSAWLQARAGEGDQVIRTIISVVEETTGRTPFRYVNIFDPDTIAEHRQAEEQARIEQENTSCLAYIFAGGCALMSVPCMLMGIVGLQQILM